MKGTIAAAAGFIQFLVECFAKAHGRFAIRYRITHQATAVAGTVRHQNDNRQDFN